MFQNGLQKIRHKKLEAIVLQKVTKKETPFGDKRVSVFILEKDGSFTGFKSIQKKKLAQFLIRKAEQMFVSKSRD